MNDREVRHPWRPLAVFAVCQAVGLGACLAAVNRPSETVDEPDALDSTQARLTELRNLGAVEVDAQLEIFEHLLRAYFRAFHPHLTADASFSIATRFPPLDDPDAPRAAFVAQVEEHMRKWHPVFGLLFMEAILTRGPEDMYALMLELPGSGQGAIAAYKRAHLEQHRRGHPDSSDYEHLLDAIIEREVGRLWGMLSTVVADNLVSILGQNLSTELTSGRTDVVGRTARILERVFRDATAEELRLRLRRSDESAALTLAIHGATTRVLTDPRKEWTDALSQFDQLLGMLCALQTAEALDHLLLLFAEFDGHVDVLGGGAPMFEAYLIQGIVDFIATNKQQDPAQELALDLIDQFTLWVVDVVELRHSELVGARIITTLLAIQQANPALMRDYVKRFYRDFHALKPAGYETVIFHLVAILVRFAEEGAFLGPDPSAPGESERPPGPPAPQEQVLEVLIWYDRALAELADTLPRIAPFFVAREQRDTLERILGFFELKYGGTMWVFERDDPRFIETILLLVERIARTLDPEDIEAYILEPVVRILSELARYQQPTFTTQAIWRVVASLAEMVGKRDAAFEAAPTARGTTGRR